MRLFLYQDPWLWITYTIHQLITNYCLLLIPISSAMLRWEPPRQDVIRPSLHRFTLAACQLASLAEPLTCF